MENKITSLEDKRFWDEFILSFNNYLDKRLGVENEFSVKHYPCLKELYNDSGSNQPTQDFTKNIATTYESIIEKIAIENGIDYKALASDGYDSVIDGFKWELKFTMKKGNSWTGTKKSVKVPNHLLIKVEVDDNRISKLGVFMADLDKCKNSSWYSNGDGKKGNYTSLKFHRDDMGKVTCVYGNLKANRIWCGVILEEINY